MCLLSVCPVFRRPGTRYGPDRVQTCHVSEYNSILYIPIQGTLLKYRLLRTYLSVHCWEWWNSLHNSVYNRMLVPWMFRLSRYLLDLIHTIPPHNQWTIRGWITSSHLWSMIVLNIYTKLRQHMFLIPLTRIDNTLHLDYLFLDCSLFCVSAGYFVFHGWDWEIW